jgi:hypothetical protein
MIHIEARKLPKMFRYKWPRVQVDRFYGVATVEVGPYVITIWR